MLAGFTNEGTFTPTGLLAADRETVSRSITLVSGQNLKRGALLGQITTGGKYTLSLSASSDGSQSPAVILAEDCDAGGGDKTTVAYFAATVDENAVIYGTGQTAAGVREALRSKGIYLQSSITR